MTRLDCPFINAINRFFQVVPKGNFNRPRGAREESLTSQAVQATLNELVRDKHGVSVPDVNVLGLIVRATDKLFDLKVQNNSNEPVRLLHFETKAVRREQNVIKMSELPNNTKLLPLSISPGHTAVLEITVQGHNIGHSKELVTLNFGDFKIGTFFEFEVTDPLLSQVMPSGNNNNRYQSCLLYTSDAADE